MSSIFQSASAFNQNISSWDTSKVISLSAAFQLTNNFNNGSAYGVSAPMNWNTSSLTGLAQTFQNANAFNQDIGGWDTTNVTTMNNLFTDGLSFDQNIGSWNVSNVTVFGLFMRNKTPATFSTANLDAIYSEWSSRPVQPGLTITFGTADYTAAGAAGKAILEGAPNNWIITDGIQV